MTKLDPGDSARAEVSGTDNNTSTHITATIAYVYATSTRFESTAISEGEGVGLGPKRNGSPHSGIWGWVGVIGRVLSPDTTIEFTVLRNLLAEAGIMESR